MFTLPIIDVKTDALDLLLAGLGFRLHSLAKNRENASFNRLIEGKNITIQFTSPTVARYYRFKNSHFHQVAGTANNADLSIAFKDSMTGAKMLAKSDVTAFMTAVQDGEVTITGDYKLVLWFAGVAKHAAKIPDEYQTYIDQAKPYTKQIINAIKNKLK
ncbi:hypothetical protein LU293_02010 [Moraxella nasovis]|uniref:hypothetical protein n=1 Tax=Moraxella nasovis TaxID=2904121 RepID=UPI001F6249B9|nr:hypothetical protein [Moraxella nasovis]UNU73708.1 hypothetical protein LU293_02010 [Moraxella nasovis]